MENYDKTKVRILNIYESVKDYRNSFVEYQDVDTGRIVLLMVKNFIKRYGV